MLLIYNILLLAKMTHGTETYFLAFSDLMPIEHGKELLACRRWLPLDTDLSQY